MTEENKNVIKNDNRKLSKVNSSWDLERQGKVENDNIVIIQRK